MIKQTNVQVTLHRISSNDATIDGKLELEVRDNNSRLPILQLYLDAQQFTNLVTAHGEVDVPAKVTVDERIGMVKVWDKEQRICACPIDSYDEKVLRAFLMKHGDTNNGEWMIEPKFGSQNAYKRITNKDNNKFFAMHIYYHRYKFVDQGEEEA